MLETERYERRTRAREKALEQAVQLWTRLADRQAVQATNVVETAMTFETFLTRPEETSED